MKIIVPIKRVIDYNVKVRVKSDGSGVDLAGVKMSMNPFDEIAVEEAVRLKEKGKATEVIVVTIGPAIAQDVIRTAMAIGADKGILITTDLPTDTSFEPLMVAKCLAKIITRETPQMVIMGKQSIDDDSNQTGQMLAALLNWPQGTYISKIDIDGDKATITREIDGGLETLGLTLPAVITTDLRLNTPRHVSLPNIMKAKQKPMETITAADLGVDLTPRLKVLGISEPEKRKSGIKVPDVDTLIDKLKTEAKVIE